MKLKSVAVSLAVIASLSACGASDTIGGDGEGNAQVKVGFLNSENAVTPLTIAMEDGYFEERGLKVEPIKFDDGTAMSQALRNGSIDFGFGSSGLIINFAPKGLGQFVLPSYLDYDTMQIISAPDSGIESVQDLRGQEVAVTVGTAGHGLLAKSLPEAGMSLDDVEIVNMAQGDAVTAMASGAVQAAALWMPFNFAAEREMGGGNRLYSYKDDYPDLGIVGGGVASNAFYRDHRDLLVEFGAAFIQATNRMQVDAAARERVWEAKFKEQEPLEAFSTNLESAKFFTDAEWVDATEAGTLDDWLMQGQELFVEIGATDTVVDPSEWFDKDLFLEMLDKASEGK